MGPFPGHGVVRPGEREFITFLVPPAGNEVRTVDVGVLFGIFVLGSFTASVSPEPT